MFRHATIMRANSSGLRISPEALMFRIRVFPSSVPVGSVTFAFCTAAENFVHADISGYHERRIELDAHGVAFCAAHFRFGNAVHHGKTLRDVGFRVLCKLLRCQRFGGQGNLQDRKGVRVDFDESRLFGHGVRHTRICLGNGRLHIQSRAVYVAVKLEFNHDHGAPLLVGGAEALDPSDTGNLFFQRFCHRGRHGFRVCAGHFSYDGDIGKLDIRHVVQRKKRIAQETEDEYSRHDQACCHRAFDENRRHVHEAAPSLW